MYKGFVTLVFAFLAASVASSQCVGCPSIAGEVIDHCYQEPSDSLHCVQFTEDSPTFFYQDKGRKKSHPLRFDLPTDLQTPSNAYLLRLQADKRLKLQAVDLLVIEHALLQWRQLEGIRKWNPEIVNTGFTVLPSGLAFKPIVAGTGMQPVKGQKVTVHYTGYLENGKKFDSSHDRMQALQFKIGESQVIKGLDEGLALMNIGARFLLRIPPKLGYGEAGLGDAIPGNATLYFDVQLINAG
jgi:hypothetical protein